MFCDKICILRKVQLHISNGTTTTKDIIGLVFGLVPNVQTVSRAIITTGVSINTVQKRVDGIKVGIFLWRWQDNLIDGIMSILYYSNNTGKYGMISELIKINTMRCHDNAVRITSPSMWGILQSPQKGKYLYHRLICPSVLLPIRLSQVGSAPWFKVYLTHMCFIFGTNTTPPHLFLVSWKPETHMLRYTSGIWRCFGLHLIWTLEAAIMSLDPI